MFMTFSFLMHVALSGRWGGRPCRRTGNLFFAFTSDVAYCSIIRQSNSFRVSKNWPTWRILKKSCIKPCFIAVIIITCQYHYNLVLRVPFPKSRKTYPDRRSCNKIIPVHAFRSLSVELRLYLDLEKPEP